MHKLRFPPLARGYHAELITVKGGFPVIATFTVDRAEPDVGIFDDQITDIQLFTTQGKPAPWIEKRLTAADREQIEDQIACCLTPRKSNRARF